MCVDVPRVWSGSRRGGLLGRWPDVVELGRVGQRPPDVTSARCSQLRQGRPWASEARPPNVPRWRGLGSDQEAELSASLTNRVDYRGPWAALCSADIEIQCVRVEMERGLQVAAWGIPRGWMLQRVRARFHAVKVPLSARCAPHTVRCSCVQLQPDSADINPLPSSNTIPFRNVPTILTRVQPSLSTRAFDFIS